MVDYHACMTKPKKGEDVRVLHKPVSELVDGINAFLNLTGRYEGRVRGIMGVGALQVKGGSSELTILTASGHPAGWRRCLERISVANHVTNRKQESGKAKATR